MGKKYWIKFFMIFTLCILCTNIPFVMFGMMMGFLPSLLVSIWLASVWSFRDSPVFIAYKTGVVGFFSVVLMQLARTYPLIQDIGLKLFWERVFDFIIWAMIPLAVLSVTMALWQFVIILIYRFDKTEKIRN